MKRSLQVAPTDSITIDVNYPNPKTKPRYVEFLPSVGLPPASVQRSIIESNNHILDFIRELAYASLRSLHVTVDKSNVLRACMD